MNLWFILGFLFSFLVFTTIVYFVFSVALPIALILSLSVVLVGRWLRWVLER